MLGTMLLDDAYRDYREHPTTDTLTALFASMRTYALTIAREYRRNDADDLAAEAVARAWVGLRTYRHEPGSSFRGWFRSIVRNVIHDFTRKAVNRYGASALNWNVVEIAGTTHDETLRSVDEIPDLTDEQRLTLKIFSITEDFDSTARHLGISQNALTARLKRIREKSLKRAS